MSQPSITTPVDIQSARHYRWGGTCDGWHLLQGPDLSVVQERVPAGASEVTHVHARARQFFYVLSGDATMVFEDRVVSFGAGQGLEVPPGIAHRFENRGEVEVLFLVISSPSTVGDRVNV